MEEESDDEEGQLGRIYGTVPKFPFSNEDEDLVEVFEKTEKFLHEMCTSSVPNDVRLIARKCYPLPKVSLGIMGNNRQGSYLSSNFNSYILLSVT